jgi:hypothetical protein
VTFSGFHLPPGMELEVESRELGGVRLESPRATPELVHALAGRLREARRAHLAERPLPEIIALVDGVARRFLDAGDPLRREAERLLHAVGGHSPEMARLILDGMASGWRAEPLHRLVARELGDGAALDGFQRVPGGGALTRAYGPELTTHVFSGNVPGVAVTSLVRALLVRSASLGKTAATEPVLPVLFCRAVAEADAGVGACLAVLSWEGGAAKEVEAAAFGEADAVIAYGGAQALRSIAARIPVGTRFLAYGPHLSLGVVLREATGDDEALRAAALAVATFDQQGCVSPHAFLVEEGGARTARDWAAALADQMERLRTELPRRSLDASEVTAIHGARSDAEFGGAPDSLVLASATDTSWTVIVDPAGGITPSCLNRMVRVHPVRGEAEITGLVAPLGGALQSVGVAGEAARVRALAGTLGSLGATRVTPLASLPWPAADGHHDGRPALADLLRWTELESP